MPDPAQDAQRAKFEAAAQKVLASAPEGLSRDQFFDLVDKELGGGNLGPGPKPEGRSLGGLAENAVNDLGDVAMGVPRLIGGLATDPKGTVNGMVDGMVQRTNDYLHKPLETAYETPVQTGLDAMGVGGILRGVKNLAAVPGKRAAAAGAAAEGAALRKSATSTTTGAKPMGEIRSIGDAYKSPAPPSIGGFSAPPGASVGPSGQATRINGFSSRPTGIDTPAPGIVAAGPGANGSISVPASPNTPPPQGFSTRSTGMEPPAGPGPRASTSMSVPAPAPNDPAGFSTRPTGMGVPTGPVPPSPSANQSILGKVPAKSTAAEGFSITPTVVRAPEAAPVRTPPTTHSVTVPVTRKVETPGTPPARTTPQGSTTPQPGKPPAGSSSTGETAHAAPPVKVPETQAGGTGDQVSANPAPGAGGAFPGRAPAPTDSIDKAPVGGKHGTTPTDRVRTPEQAAGPKAAGGGASDNPISDILQKKVRPNREALGLNDPHSANDPTWQAAVDAKKPMSLTAAQEDAPNYQRYTDKLRDNTLYGPEGQQPHMLSDEQRALASPEAKDGLRSLHQNEGAMDRNYRRLLDDERGFISPDTLMTLLSGMLMREGVSRGAPILMKGAKSTARNPIVRGVTKGATQGGRFVPKDKE